MKKNLLLFGLTFALTIGTFTAKSQEAAEPCSQYNAQEELFNNNPGMRAEYDEYYKNLVKKSQEPTNKREDLYIIPVVFHVLHDGTGSGIENLSFEQLEDAVETMNLEFNLENSAVSGIKSEFKDIAADCNIQFRLATTGPDGGCTNGVMRYDDERTNSADESIKSGRQWPTTKYLNIYTVRSIASGAAGYAYFPGAGPNNDGIVILHNYVGRIGTGNANRSSALTHEVGHYLALPHVWGNGNNPGDQSLCSTDDGIEDTPLTTGNRTCNLNVRNCGTLDNVQNFMDYAYCYANFTLGQKAVMRAALEGTRSGRNNLWSESNLIETGVLYDRDNIPVVLCNADFEKDSKEDLCPGSDLSFTNLSYSGDGLTYEWTFENGTPATSTEKNPSVNYNVSGKHDVTLVVSDGTNSITEVKEEFVSVLAEGALPFPYITDLELTEVNGDEFEVMNIDDDARTWEKSTTVGFGDNSSFFIENRINPTEREDLLVSNTMNTVGNQQFFISFRYAYAERSSNGNDDQLRVQISRDCGQNWATRKSLRGNSLITADRISSKFEPADESEWETALVNVTNYESSGFRFRFQWTSGGGNNIYIDDINVSNSAVGINSILESNLSVYPNPASNQLYINGTDNGSFNLINIAGKEVMNGEVLKGENKLDIANLPAGLYLLKITNGNAVATKRVVIK